MQQSSPSSLFAYGTLLPGEPRWHFLQPFVVDEGRVASVAGMLFDTGEGYPAAVFGADGTIHGRVFELLAARHDEALEVLDAVEGGVEGGYRRVVVTTADDEPVWAYAYGGGLQLTPIEGGSWVLRRR
jgi:gamma-glutamylcyclotransferase (GGCT)/AIG2-like uncharacterized protein YtfP